MAEINGNGTEYWLTSDYIEPGETLSGKKHIFIAKLILVLLFLAVGISVLTYIAIKKRKVDQLRNRLMPFYKFEPDEEEDEWQTELLEEIDTNTFTRLKDYRSTHSVTSIYHDEKCF